MASAPLLQLSDISLSHGGNPVFEGVNLTVQPGDRIALVGRNGSGKSTLMKIMAGLVEPDRGSCILPQGMTVGYMEQEPTMSGFVTLGDYARAGLEEGEEWRLAVAAEGLAFDPDTPVAAASGGERRRAALARLLAEAPDLMLLDEPTNHLDIAAIEWLEETLKDIQGAFVLISHDRAVLRNVTRATLWIDRGVVRRRESGFDGFEAWRDKLWEDEDTARHKLDRKIASEGRWAVEGISARRKRNQGRLRALQDMRKDRRDMIRRQGTAALALEAGPQSGKKVIEARGISKSFGDRVICRDLDLRIVRGDRVAFVGPNGVGKTTVLEMLTGRLAPDAGSVTLGTGVELAVFDQRRAALDPQATLWESLTGDPGMRVSGASDQVMVRGAPRHVVGYLKDFLFDESRARAPVRSLSGGERARLLLARLMARESNLLVLDEPTNDLDIETLDLLQELLDGYPGTVLLVSHDRDFLDRVATATLLFDGQGRITPYAGGWTDAMAQRGEAAGRGGGGGGATGPDPKPSKGGTAAAKPAEKPSGTPAARGGLSFTEQHRLEELPALIARLEAEMAKLATLLADPDLYTREPVKFAKATEALAERQARLDAAEEEWLGLAERAENA